MKRAILLVLSLALVAGLAGVVSAHNTNALAPRELAYVPDANIPVIDGKLDPNEYDWVPDKFRLKLADYLTAEINLGWRVLVGETSSPYNAEDFDVPFAFLGWNPTINALVIAVQTVDDVGFFSQPYFETWRTIDSIYWYMDANHSGGVYQYFDPGRSGIDGQQGIFRPESARGGRPDLPMWFCYSLEVGAGDFAFREPYVKAAITIDEATGSYTLETTMQVWDWIDRGGESASTLHTLVEGEAVGMRFGIMDMDLGGENDIIYFTMNSASSVSDNAFTSDGFEDAYLLSAADTGVATAVEASSWGRIKSTFR